MPKGGSREGSGRKPLPPGEKRERRVYYLTQRENEAVKATIRRLREGEEGQGDDDHEEQ